MYNKRPQISTAEMLQLLKMQIRGAMNKDLDNQISREIQKRGIWRGLDKVLPSEQQNTGLEIDPNTLNDCYVAISTKNNSKSASFPTRPLNHPNFPNTFKMKPLTCEAMHHAWKNMKNKNSTSHDPLNICTYMINIGFCSYIFTDALVNIFNNFIETGHVPGDYKLSRIVPVPKVKTPTSANETRPIGIQPVLTKLFEKCLLIQLNSYIYDEKLLSPYQYGFRQRISTTHAHIAITDAIYEQIDKDNICILVSLDFQKAFDLVDRDILIQKMESYGINCPIIKSLLQESKQYVVCHDENGNPISSQVKQTQVGVIQGSSVSVILFCLMISDLPCSIKNSKTFMFADVSYLLTS